MTEKQAWRPPLAPKPSPATLQIHSPPERHPSPALHGAASAFSPPSAKSPTTTKPVTTSSTKTASHSHNHPTPSSKNANPSQNASAGALLAAAAAQKAKPLPISKDGIGIKASTSPARGRSQLAIELERAASTNNKSTDQPRLNRTTSAIAARAASASPVRNTEISLTAGSLQNKTSQNYRGFRNREHSTSESETPLGMNGSVSASPSAKAKSPLSSSVGKLDLEHIPILRQSTPVAKPAPKPRSVETKPASTRPQTIKRAAAPTRFPQVVVSESENQSSGSTSPIAFSPQDSTTLSSVTSPLVQVSTAESFYNDEGYFHRSPPSEPKPPKQPGPFQVGSPTHLRPSLRPTATLKSSESKVSRKNLTPSTLADAMVASSLASSRVPSRAPSPTKAKPKVKPPPPPLRRSQSSAPVEIRLYDVDLTPKTKPLPIRPMKQTLRKHAPGNSDDEETKRGRKHWVRKHPNKHHEGDRKRWRDKLTERERKRYEGVWAANRGLLWDREMTDLESLKRRKGSTVEQDLVLNVVVRDIWERSRLPRDVLEEIWDLVATEGSKFLTKEEFVVGLWLVDQRLKGRKLPYKVSPSVWSSVRHIQGVKISHKPIT